ncbi:MAG: hypothetical protein H5T65_06925 [Chloroflexi bacterium]|nr:hypothetical protein [Chloroflexota bacterium]
MYKTIAYALSLIVVLSLLVACGPGALPTATPPAASEPTDTPAPTPVGSGSPASFEEHFEGDLERWQQGSDVPDDPDRPGQPVAWSIEISPEQAAGGRSAAQFTLDGKMDDGTIWLARAFNVAPNAALQVRLAFDLWSDSESFNTLAKVCAYAGPRPPAAEEDFDVSQAANRVQGWKRYEYAFNFRSGADGQAWVAFGISAVWETTMTYYVDNVRVDIVPASGSPTDDVLLVLPESAVVLSHLSLDMDGNGAPESVVLAGWGGGADRLGYDFLQVFVVALPPMGEPFVVWQSEQLPTDRAEALQTQDLTGDGLPEVLSVQAMGAGGEMLYVLGWQGGRYGWLLPRGGHFDGAQSFGENGVRVEDSDGDGLTDILASYGPAASLTDVYTWDGQAFVYHKTLGDDEPTYQRVTLADAGLSLDVPSGWVQSKTGVWVAPQDDALRLGVAWADLQPPVEAETLLLPQPAQILDSEPAELSWGKGRRFTVEVYGEAVQGEGKAAVKAVETHVLVVIQQDGARRAFDIYISAPDAEQLASLSAALQRALTSAALR